ncbi:class I SAM-dependent methyltransferase [Stutzerimonas stutzeri]|uniref:class I SAM-dependent methyltransferase n=1 Tax=Stutzerimonas sp. S1 TaxID=3030652 RepID=UPI0022257799|nr:class I SAM-dependent methyltransferase [Stutzerimonas sp. S1]MCW3147321.1 class I SAM-dependent methyltransferase [Stutzerimonas sp. S1]
MFDSLRSRLPILTALCAQFAAVLLTWLLLLGALRLLDVRLSLLQAAVVQGVIAALLGARLGLSSWWLPINLGFVPGLALLQNHSLPTWLPAAALVLLLLLNWNAFVERVPLYLTGTATERCLQQRLRALPGHFRFVDLGCGLAGSLSRLARAFPQARFVGVETAPLTFAIAWLRCLPRSNCRIVFRNLWRVDLADFEVVYCFLSPAPMPALWRKASAQMRADALLISNSFGVPGVEPEERLAVSDWRDSQLLIWRPGGRRSPDGQGATG